MEKRYTVWVVDRAGNMQDAYNVDRAIDALALVKMEQYKRGPRMAYGTAGICDNEFPESGDCQDRLREEMEA